MRGAVVTAAVVVLAFTAGAGATTSTSPDPRRLTLTVADLQHATVASVTAGAWNAKGHYVSNAATVAGGVPRAQVDTWGRTGGYFVAYGRRTKPLVGVLYVFSSVDLFRTPAGAKKALTFYRTLIRRRAGVRSAPSSPIGEEGYSFVATVRVGATEADEGYVVWRYRKTVGLVAIAGRAAEVNPSDVNRVARVQQARMERVLVLG